ncbi:MAG TPA: site-2 protease family protein [Pirellulales bacterium]|jgi:Zn-dependent protease|nr:site-2 protease family protein [Pirellulales bacterium]
MRDLLSWNVSLGRWAGVQVRLHFFYLLFVAFALHHSWREGLLGYGCAALAILTVSALLHEFGHCVAAWRVGGNAEQVLLWPLGGLSHINPSQDPQNELLTALAGPVVNFAICAALAPVLVVLGDGAVMPGMLNPLEPPVPIEADSLGALPLVRCAFWINWMLALMNVLPAFPLDGGRALRAVLWPRFGYRTAVLLVARTAYLTAIVLGLLAWFAASAYPFAPLPLALLAVFLFFAAKQEAERLQEGDSSDSSFGYDFSQGYTSLERHLQPKAREPGPLRRWLDRRREERAERQQQLEQEEERRVDDILVRLHELGRDGLSPEDRALLDRVSARYRNRMRG